MIREKGFTQIFRRKDVTKMFRRKGLTQMLKGGGFDPKFGVECQGEPSIETSKISPSALKHLGAMIVVMSDHALLIIVMSGHVLNWISLSRIERDIGTASTRHTSSKW